MPSHHPKRSNSLSIVRDESRHKRVERALPRLQAIGVLWVKRKPTTSVLQRDACAGNDNI